jgi:hypothetical protein
MKRTVIGAAVAAMVLLMHTSPLAAQDGGRGGSPQPKEAAGPVPRMADGHPDLSGVWWPGADVPVKTLKVGTNNEVPSGNPRQGPDTFAKLYLPGPAAKAKTLSEKDDPALRCVPSIIGPHVALVNNGLVGQIIQSPKFVVFLTETYHSFKIIPTDGRGHRDDVAPSYRGDSVGRWDGDTLVVDSTNFSGENWVSDHGNVSFYSDALHIVERYRRLDAKRLEVSTTVEDSKMLTRPWVLTPEVLQIAPFDQIMEVWCTNTVSADLFEGAAKSNYGRK